MAWRSTGVGSLEFRRWPEQWLVFNPLSGATHLLSAFAGLVLETLDEQQQLLSREALIEQLAGGESLSDEEAQALDAALDSFRVLGLAEEAWA